MRERKIYITNFDMKRLKELVEVATEFSRQDEKHLEDLENELQRSYVVDSKDIPKDVITMNSKVRLRDLDNGKEIIFSLVFPAEADIDQNRLSVLAPIGTAILGCKTGDVIQLNVPAGMRKLKIEEIMYQPESAGNYDL
ncbi:MAG: nucleoside diphosphate kinase regulator [Candidatus Tritonobacter lacicola]|nr:nucleoside diphosphate kinase regulator [Candidatus Tritonobacter lacicola]